MTQEQEEFGQTFLTQFQKLERSIKELNEQLEAVRKVPVCEIQIADIIVKSNGATLNKCLDVALEISGLKRIQNDLRIQEAWHL